MTQLNWDDARVFLALARAGTLTRAAQNLALGIATLSRRIERLEKALNTPLFVRAQTGYQLTEEGMALLESAEQMETAMFAFCSQAEVQNEIQGHVRLATAENMATTLIIPKLPDFLSRYPSLTLDLVTDVRTSNLHRHDADLALRMVRPTQGNVSFRRIGKLGYGIYAGIAGDDRPQGRKATGQSAYSESRFIGWSESYHDLPAARWLAQHLKTVAPVLTTSAVATQVAACRSGVGLAVLPHIVARQAGLVCLEHLPAVEQDIYLVMHTDLSHARRVRAVAGFVAGLVEDNARLLAFPDA
ncbi:LysR family transcriptional regulator [Vibrio quintilis]|uniref:HTH-type transcriptional regulator YofA n=1 Tax=Vibrio quintilis TaxID=1117707 RepID=A0A1M7YXA3_9VIBR|nr:LysR family transcriptional regulator [Vibrio quintilis]SHO57309.1 HTH-type transcriptional regulator YofA [Vibrio quintilis]